MAERRQVHRRIGPLDLRGGVWESSFEGIRLLMRLILAKNMLTQIDCAKTAHAYFKLGRERPRGRCYVYLVTRKVKVEALSYSNPRIGS